jgi:hypothetical protein
MPLSDWVKIFGSNKPPTAVRNLYAAPIQTAGRRLAVDSLNSLRTELPGAYNAYNAFQPKQEELAGQQEGVLNTLLNRRLAYDPNQSLRDIFQTAFSQIDPNVVSPLSRFDVNTNILANRARGINTGAIDSTAERLRNARIASGRYYDVARQVYGVVPTLFNQSYQQGIGSDQAAAGYVPGISAAYEAVANRPMQGLLNYINAARQGQAIESQGITNALGSTQGYKQHQNWADKAAGALGADEKAAMDIAKMALSFYTGGLAGGGAGGGGGMGGLMSMFGGGGGGQPSGTPAYGSQYPGAGGMYYSAPQYGGQGYSAPMT